MDTKPSESRKVAPRAAKSRLAKSGSRAATHAPREAKSDLRAAQKQPRAA